MITLLEDLKNEFDLIIIDGTPSKLVTDAVILSRLVDSTIIVTGHNVAKKDDLAKVVRDIKNVGGNIAGIVYNKKPISGKKNTETYYYASASAKWEARKKQKDEEERKKQEQHSKTAEILRTEKSNNENEPEKFREEITSDMLKQLDEYWQKEKENKDNNRG